MNSSRRWPCPWIAAALLVVALFARAQEQTSASPVTNTARSAEALIAEVLERNPELSFYEAEMDAARAGRKSAGLLANPELSGSIGQKSVHGGGVKAEGIAWSVSVLQPFEWPGRNGLRKALANQDVELARLGLEQFKMALLQRVHTLTYELFAAQEKSAAATEVAERFQALREVLVQRDPAGLTPLLETRVVEATELNAQRKASEASRVARAALLTLNQLRGAALDAPLTIEPMPLEFRAAPAAPVLMTLARSNNFELRVRAAELAQQGFRVDLAKSERYPAIAIGPSFAEERAGDRERVIGLSVSVPLPVWNRNSGNIESAKARQTQAETSFYITQREIERRVLEAALTYETKVQEMAKWRPEAARHFREAAELADRHYRLGAVPVSVYIELQSQYLEAVESLLDTRKEALEAAAALESLTGLKPSLVSRVTAATEP